MEPWILTALLFGTLLILLLTGLPIVFAFGALSALFIAWQWGPQALYVVATTAFSTWTEYMLITVPMFILMGAFLERSGMADKLFDSMYKWMGPLRGGLAIGTVAICALFAAMAGISAVGTLTMGMIALPAMLKRGYDKAIAVGCISAGGTLGILIPPSLAMIVYCSLTGESVGQMFMAGIIPGALIAVMFASYIAIRCYFNPNLGPAVPINERITSISERIGSLRSIFLPLFLVLIVLGLIYLGVTTPSEAAGIGAFGAFTILIIYGKLTRKVLNESLLSTIRITAMVMWILVGGKCFAHAYAALGAADFVQQMIGGWEVSPWVVVIIMQLIALFLGCFMDPGGITVICAPIFVPIIKEMGFDPVWFGILFTINLELGYITPPFGLNLFYMKSLVPPDITMNDIYKSIAPYVAIEILAVALIMLFPQIALWLPTQMGLFGPK